MTRLPFAKHCIFGFGLIEVLISSSIITIISLAVTGLFVGYKAQDSQIRVVSAIMDRRAEIDAAINNPVAWGLTVKNPLNLQMQCATADTTGCYANAAGGSNGFYDMVVFDASGQKVSYDAADPTSRTWFRGGRCPAGVPDPDAACPVKFLARWKPLCAAYPCLKPTIQIEVEMLHEFADGQNARINKFNYGYSSIRGIDENNIEAACRILNGAYDSTTGSCLPKFTNRSCVALGKPYQVVTEVRTDGTIDCRPIYTGSCDPTDDVVSSINANGTVNCAPRVCNCMVAWGPWSSCSANCGGGTQSRNGVIISSPKNGGAGCPPIPETQACNTQACPVSCVGSWSACGGCPNETQTYSITTPASGGGAPCETFDGDTRACSTGTCGPVCIGAWGPCLDPDTGQGCDNGAPPGPSRTYTVSVPGIPACPFVDGATQACALIPCGGPVVNCSGGWGACGGACPNEFETYTITQYEQNGGTPCSNPNGDTRACSTGACLPPSCIGAWSNCSKNCNDGSGPGTETYIVTQPGVPNCPFADGTVRTCNDIPCGGTDCVGSWGLCNPGCGPGTQIYTITNPATGSGAACSNPDNDVRNCNDGPCNGGCAPNNGLACTGQQYQSWSAIVPESECGGVACTECDYATNRCLSAGMTSCDKDYDYPGLNAKVVCWANFEASGNYDCAGVCKIGGCPDYVGCTGMMLFHQFADCRIQVIAYFSPACP